MLDVRKQRRKMPVAPRTLLSSAKSQTKMSAWTPLNHTLTNNNLFFERRTLLEKWFDKWSDTQRKLVLQDFLSRCSVNQLKFLDNILKRKLPPETADFTCLLPRVLCLYLFSFLDPRSLCRCAQVCWRWKSLVELDQLWMPKCLKQSWCITFSPTPLEQGVWKKHYIGTVEELQVSRPQTPSATQQQLVVPEAVLVSVGSPAPLSEEPRAPQQVRCSSGRGLGWRWRTQTSALPPWRHADRHPKDTLRYNYLANLDPNQQAQQAQMKSRTTGDGNQGTMSSTRDKPLSEANYKLRKAKSLQQIRPKWATRSLDNPVTKETAEGLVRSAQRNAGLRPGPARASVPRLSTAGLRASQRTHRTAPSTPLFDPALDHAQLKPRIKSGVNHIAPSRKTSDLQSTPENYISNLYKTW